VGDDDSKIPAHYAAEAARFYAVHAGWLFGYACLRASGDRELGADLVQGTFDAAGLDWDTVRELAAPQQRVWPRTTLSRKVSSHIRRPVAFRRRQPRLRHRCRAAEPDPEQARSAAALERAAKIIEGLPDRQKGIALMKWINHIKEPEIAAELGCAKGTVAAQVHEIRRKLIDGLGPYYPFAGDGGEGEAS
jgi:DNA-directed RNA polymerase specialized sigma24 family protein